MPRLLANFGLLTFAETLSKLLTFAALAYLARKLGPAGFGDIEFAAAVIMCAGLVVDLGFGPYGAREIARDPAHTAALVGEIIFVRLTLAVVAYAIIAAVALWFAPSPAVGKLLLLYGLSLLGMPFLLQWVFQGHDAMGVVAFAAIVRQAVFAAVVFVFVRDAHGTLRVGLAECAAVAAAAVLCIACYARRFAALPRVSPRLSPKLLREGGAIGLSQLFWAARMYGGVVILRYVAPVNDVGYYASASRILLAVHTFVWLYFFNLLPSLTRCWQSGRDPFAAMTNRSLRVVAWAAALFGVIWVFAAPAAAPLAFGRDFAPAALPLQWLAGVCVAAAINGHYRYGLIAAGRQSTEMLIQAAGALVTAVGIPLGYRLAGPAGAAGGLLASELLIWAVAWYACRAALGLTGQIAPLMRPLAACIVAAACLMLLPIESAWARAALASAVVAIAALAFDPQLRRSVFMPVVRERPA